MKDCSPSAHSCCRASRQYGLSPLIAAASARGTPARNTENALSAVRYPENSAYTVLFQSEYAPTPTTCWPSASSIIVLALGATATDEEANGKPHAGTVLKTSCRPGLLFMVRPSRTPWSLSPICCA